MFSTSGPTSEDPPAPAGTTEPPEPAGLEAARAFDQALRDLRPPGSPAQPPDVASVAAAASEHAETLRATRDARQEAQEMLAMATEARKTASEEAERIVLEARDAAERTRQELAGWAAAQRAKVDALVSDMVDSANRDADAIRAEALRTSMADAEEAARRHVADAVAAAERDAEAIRGDAGSVLHRATELGGEAEEAIVDLTTTVADVLTRLQATRAAMAQLLAEHRPAGIGPDALDEDAGSGEEEAAEGPLDLDELDDEGQERDPSAEEIEHADDAVPPADEEAGPADGERTDRQLGAIFRRYGHGG